MPRFDLLGEFTSAYVPPPRAQSVHRQPSSRELRRLVPLLVAVAAVGLVLTVL